MSSEMKRIVSRVTALFSALGLGAAMTVLSVLTPAASKVSALPTGNQITFRAIYMTSSVPSATGVTYDVTFKPATTSSSIKGIILDFCDLSPIINDPNCSAPDKTAATPTFNLGGSGSPSVTYASTTAPTDPVTATGLPGGSGVWTATDVADGTTGLYRTLKLSASAGQTLTAGTSYTFQITGVTNPATYTTTANPTLGPQSFYARLVTYTANGAGSDFATYTPSSVGSTDALDYGGFALSTAYQIDITAKVQEQLSFCASALDLSDSGNSGTNNSCQYATAPTINIGHGTPPVITATAVDAAPVYTQASTNATHGLVIRMHSLNACTQVGLSRDGGTTCTDIPGVGYNDGGNEGAAPTAMPAGTPAFGLFVAPSTLTASVSTSTGTIAPDANYYDSGFANTATPANLHYGMDDGNSTNALSNISSVESTYGDQIASSTGPVSQVNNAMWFGATAGLVTPAGIYTVSEVMIATGTF